MIYNHTGIQHSVYQEIKKTTPVIINETND